jgi:hypothetical protein
MRAARPSAILDPGGANDCRSMSIDQGKRGRGSYSTCFGEAAIVVTPDRTIKECTPRGDTRRLIPDLAGALVSRVRET